jgi:hypothetical protein
MKKESAKQTTNQSIKKKEHTKTQKHKNKTK